MKKNMMNLIKLIAMMLVAILLGTTVALADEATTAAQYTLGITWNTKGIEGLPSTKNVPKRIYSSDPLADSSTAWWRKTFNKEGFVVKTANATADDSGLKELRIAWVEDSSGTRVPEEETQQILDQIQALLVRTVRTKKGAEGQTTNLETYKKKVHKVAYILHLDDGSTVKVFTASKDGQLCLCKKAKPAARRSGSSGTSSKPAGTPSNGGNPSSGYVPTGHDLPARYVPAGHDYPNR